MSPKRPGRSRTTLIVAITALILVAACSQALTLSPSPDPASPSHSASSSPTASASPTPEPTPDPLNRNLLDRRFTVLIVGEDVDAARRARGYYGDNTDAIMLVSVSPGQKRVTMLSLPRDTVDVPLANGQIWSGKVNAIANSYGLDGLRTALATMWDIKIPYYVKVNMDDFVALVDAVDGISVKVETVVQEPRWGLYLTPGRAHLDGITALHFSRARYYDSDYARAARQQQVIRALARKYTDPATEIDLGGLLGTLAGLETNLPLQDLPTLAVLARRAGRAAYASEVLMPPAFALGWGDQHDGRGWVIIPNVEAMRAEVQRMFAD
jgi:polyisoprenyl-teichoic acid--peptidoglycan teichoic acid transferase